MLTINNRNMYSRYKIFSTIMNGKEIKHLGIFLNLCIQQTIYALFRPINMSFSYKLTINLHPSLTAWFIIAYLKNIQLKLMN